MSSQQVVDPSHDNEVAAQSPAAAMAIADANEDDDISIDDDGHLIPKPTAAEVYACQFSSWYYTFRNMNATSTTNIVADNINNNNPIRKSDSNNSNKRHKLRRNVAIESIIIRPLPSDFIQYLLSDGVRLPECATKVSSCMNDDVVVGGTNNNHCGSSSSEDEEDEIEDEDDEPETTYSFPSLTQQLQSSIIQLGTMCMPKMNWSSPKDATWINCGTLKCSTPCDVYLLLKCSDFVVFDLAKAWENLHEEKHDNKGSTFDNLHEKGGGEVRQLLDELKLDETSTTARIATPPTTLLDECTKNANNDDDDDDANDDDGDDAKDNIKKQQQQTTPLIEFQHELVLRKWCNLHPSMEFRCFIYEHELGELYDSTIERDDTNIIYPDIANTLPFILIHDEKVAISQRHPSKFYSHLQPPSNNTIHPSILTLHSFFHTYVRCKFAMGTIHRYVLDVYIDSRERVWIVDFNVWGARTDGLLFDWKELMMLGCQIRDVKSRATGDGVSMTMTTTTPCKSVPMPEVRVVTKDMKSMTYDPLSSYRGPTDVVDLLGSGGDTSAPFFEEFMKQCVRPSEL